MIFTVACSSQSTRKPATQEMALVPAPANALTIEKALDQGPEATLQYLKDQGLVKVTEAWNEDSIPDSVRIEKQSPESSAYRGVLLHHLRRFKPWTLARKENRAHQLINGFKCEAAIESQAMGLSLERDFPDESAQNLSKELLDKTLDCEEGSKQESLFRLIVFSIQRGHCDQALNYVQKFPKTTERGVQDRLMYLQGFCSPQKDPQTVATRNPWGGYGIRLGDVGSTIIEKPIWYLTARSGSVDWDQALGMMAFLLESKDFSKFQYIAARLNYEKLRTLPHAFQASMMALLHFGNADLAVFQTLHRFLAEHPQFATKDVAELLFPVRYWREIVENSQGTDPILVKSLIRQESAFNPTARSRARAFGLMQLIYPTAKIFGVKKPRDLLRPDVNIRAGTKFLNQLIQEFGSVEMALAAYNAGPEVVHEWKKRYPTDNMDLFVEMIPYTETREYVRLIHRNYRIYQSLLQPEILPMALQPMRMAGQYQGLVP